MTTAFLNGKYCNIINDVLEKEMYFLELKLVF